MMLKNIHVATGIQFAPIDEDGLRHALRRTFRLYRLRRVWEGLRRQGMSYLAGYAIAAGVANPVGAAVRNSFAQAVGAGRGEDYVPMLSDFIAEANGLERK